MFIFIDGAEPIDYAIKGVLRFFIIGHCLRLRGSGSRRDLIGHCKLVIGHFKYFDI